MKLTEIARKTLGSYFKGEKFELDESVKQKYNEKKACFVTLTKDGSLRGCIGSLYATRPLWREIQENSLRAAFQDPRFYPLKEQELGEIKIEVSVLSEPKKLSFKNPDELLKKINKNMGVIIKKEFKSATFLPQVWKQIPDKKEFLEQLCLKAGLNKDEWKSKAIEIFYYFVESEEE